MKQAFLPKSLCDGDTGQYPDTVIQVMALPLVDDQVQNVRNISLGKTQLAEWANDNLTEIVGWQHDHAEYEGKHILRLTMYGRMLRPELAYRGSYPVYEHEREGYVAAAD